MHRARDRAAHIPGDPLPVEKVDEWRESYDEVIGLVHPTALW